MKLTKGKSTFTKSEADQIVHLINQKVKASTTNQKNIRNKIRKLGFYASDFGLRDGYTANDFLRSVKVIGSQPVSSTFSIDKISVPKTKAQTTVARDEHYIINLCDEVIGEKAIRQHKFDFLKGDTGHRLPVDAFYHSKNLVIEYRERQHAEAVSFFDKRITASGISRGDQRKKYDELRRNLLPKNGFNLIEFDYHEFNHNSQKRLLRSTTDDLKTIKSKLQQYL